MKGLWGGWQWDFVAGWPNCKEGTGGWTLSTIHWHLPWALAAYLGHICLLSNLVMSDSLKPLWTLAHQARISQTRILEWAAISYAKGSSPPKDRTWVSCVSCTGRQILYHWATKEASHVPSVRVKSYSTRIKSGSSAAADLQQPLKGVQDGDQELCALGKTGRTGLKLDTFRSWFYKPGS